MSESSRPSLPTSSSDFALPSSSSSSALTLSIPAATDLNPFMLRIRRPSFLSPRVGYYSESRIHSPLATAFSLTRRTSVNGEESESDKEKMSTDSPPLSDSGNATPLLPPPVAESEGDSSMKSARSRSPATPPRAAASSEAAHDTAPRYSTRRPSHPVKMPRILTLLSESRPEENELKSEAQFQRLVASCSALPSQPRTPRAASDRGRYPEEADSEETLVREDTPSDDEGELDESTPFAFEPLCSTKPVTPAQSVNGDDLSMLDSPGGMAMDVDIPSVVGSPSISSWRYTPPPTTSAVRSNKRKFDDRYDPYPNAQKRRAVSPSVSYLRESQPSLFSSRASASGRISIPIPIPLPIAIPGASPSAVSSPISVSSSPYFGSGRPSFGSTSALSSPTLRAQMIGLRARRDEEKQVDGAGEAVNGLSLE